MKLPWKFSSFFAGFLLFPLLAFGQSRYDNFTLKPLPAGGVTPVSGLVTVCPGSGFVTTGASVTGNVATLTFASSPITAGFVNGRDIIVFGFTGTDTYFNQTRITLTGVTSSTVTFALTHANNSASTNGGIVQYPTSSSGCAPTTTVYSDQALTTPLSEPFGTDANGNYGFWGTPGTYYTAIAATGIASTLTTVTLPPSVPVNLATQVTGTLPGANMAAVNLATSGNGGVTGVLPGANMAATNLAGGNNPGGVSGILPNANLNTQGTDANLLTAGTVSASTGVALCTDANHGATTSGCTPGGVTEATLSTGGFAVSWNIACTAGSTGHCAYTTFANAHTLVRITYDLTQAPSSCATNAVVGVRDVTAGSNVSTITVNQGVTGYVDSGALSAAMTAGHEFLVGVITAAATCTTVPNGHSIVMVYQ